MKIVLTLQTPLKEPFLQSNGLQLFSSLSVRITWEAFEMLIPATYHTHSDSLYLGRVPDPRIFILK